jgi:hypothetical protein
MSLLTPPPDPLPGPTPPADPLPPPASVAAGGTINEAGITVVSVGMVDTNLMIRWTADPAIVPADALFHVYIDRVLTYTGPRNWAAVPPGASGRRVLIDVGWVAPGDRLVSFGGALTAPAGTGNRALLEWIGGRWQDDILAGFYIYSSSAPGAGVDYARVVATVPAAVGGQWGDGFGRGLFGRGPYGRGSVEYSWTSGPLASGTWQFCVAAYDRAVNIAPGPPVVAVTISNPPGEPGMSGGRRIWVAATDPAAGTATIAWNPGLPI